MTLDDFRFTAVLRRDVSLSAVLFRLLKLAGLYSLLSLGGTAALIGGKTLLSIFPFPTLWIAVLIIFALFLFVLRSGHRSDLALKPLALRTTLFISFLFSAVYISEDSYEYGPYAEKQRDTLKALDRSLSETRWATLADGNSTEYRFARINNRYSNRGVIELTAVSGGSREVVGVMELIPRGPNLVISIDINADYRVAEYSSAGKAEGYLLQESPVSRPLIEAIDSSVNKLIMESYQDSSIEIEVIGFADGTPVAKQLFYRGDLGTIKDVPYFYYNGKNVKSMTLYPGQGITTNETIAFLRAFSLAQRLSVTSIAQRVVMRIGVETSSLIGPYYRRIVTAITLKDALKHEYRELGPLTKRFIELALPDTPGSGAVNNSVVWDADRGARRSFLRRFPFGSAISLAAERHHIDGLLLAAIVETESGFKPDAVAPNGAIGLMQVLPEVAGTHSANDLFVPQTNLDVGSRYLRRMLALYGSDLELALAAYNAGPSAVARDGGVPPYPERQEYVRRVLDLYNAYNRCSGEVNCSPDFRRESGS